MPLSGREAASIDSQSHSPAPTAGFEAPSRLPAGSAASDRFQADVWNAPVRRAMVLKKAAADSQPRLSASSATAFSRASRSSAAAQRGVARSGVIACEVGEEGVEVGQRAAVGRVSGHEAVAEADGAQAEMWAQPLERRVVRPCGVAARAFGGNVFGLVEHVEAEGGRTVGLYLADMEPAVADGAAHLPGQAAVIAIVADDAGGLLVGGADDDQRRSGGAGPGSDRLAAVQRLGGKRPPHRGRAVAAEMREADDDVLAAVHAARKGRHQGDGDDDPHDFPAAEAEAALARRVDRAGGDVPDQEGAGEDEDGGVEGEEHAAQRGAAFRLQVRQEGEQPAGSGVLFREDGRRLGSRGGGGERQQRRAAPPISGLIGARPVNRADRAAWPRCRANSSFSKRIANLRISIKTFRSAEGAICLSR